MKTNLLFGMFVVAALGFVASNVQAQEENVDGVSVVQEEISEIDETTVAEEEAVEEENVVEETKDADVLYGVQKLDEVKNLSEAAPAVATIAQDVAPIRTVVSGVAGAAQVYGPCEECYGIGIRGVGFGRFAGRGIALPARQGRFASRFANREIAAPSPYANPTGDLQDWARFRNYPYGYYPQNFGAPDMSVPNYNPRWQNFYPNSRRFHEGKHFILDVF